MQFKIAKTHRYWWPVTVRIPDPETAGTYLEQSLKIQFEPLPREEQLMASEATLKLKTARELYEHEIATARRVVRNWDGVVDEAGDPVPFSPELLESSLQQTWFRKAVNDALNASMNGEEARAGN